MRFVKKMDERYYNEMITEIERCFHGLNEKLSHYAPGTQLFPKPITENGTPYPFPLAAEIHHIYRYLIGEEDMPARIASSLEGICELVWYNPFTQEGSYNIDWMEWERTRVGYFVRCAYIAVSLDAGETVNSKQLSMLAGITPNGVIKQIKEGKITGVKQGREWVIESHDAVAYLKSQLKGMKNT